MFSEIKCKNICINNDFKGGFKRIYFYHVRKAGGTSLNNIMLSLSDENSKDVYRRLAKSSSHRIIAGDKVYCGWNRLLINRGTYFYAFSHTPAHKLKLPKGTFTVTIIRDPVNRVISHYKMLVEMKQNSSDHPCTDTEGKWLGENFNDFLDNIPKTDLLNQLYMFSESYDIDEAFNNIIDCSYFFLTEKFDKGIEDLSSKTGLDLKPIHTRKSSIDVHISS